MRTLPSALTEAQKRAPLEWPKVRIRIRKRIGGVRRLDYERLYTGDEPDGPHCAVMPSDGSLNRFRVDPGTHKLYRQRIADPEDPGADPAFGHNGIGETYDGPFADWKHACKYTLSQATTIKSIKWYTASYSGTGKAKAVVYADDAGTPGALLATSQEVTGIDTTPAWHTATFDPLVDLPPGDYWLGVIAGDQRQARYYDPGGASQAAVAPDTYADGPANPFGDVGIWNDYKVSIYAVAADWPDWTDTGETARAVACATGYDGTGFGGTSGSSGPLNIQADHKAASKFTLDRDKAVTSIGVRGSADTATCRLKAVIYEDDAGAPGDLLGTSQEITVTPGYDAYHYLPFVTPVDLTAGDYWLGIIVGDNTFLCRYASGDTDQCATNADTYSDGPADPFGPDPTYYDYALRIWALLKSDVLLAFVDNSSPYHVWVIQSDDNGETWGSPVHTSAISDVNGRVAIDLKGGGPVCILYTRGANLYARKRTDGVWGSEISAGYGLTSISGVAMQYEADWNFLLTGVDGYSQDGLWSGIFGDGYSQAVDTFSPLRPISLRESTEPYQYTAPALAYPDVHRAFFVEKFTDPTAQNRVYFSYCPATADYVNNLWHEPIPFNLETIYGMAVAYDNQNVWLSTPYGVWKAFMGTEEWDITDDVVAIEETDAPHRYRSKLKVVLDNTNAKYNDFDKLGYDIVFGKGYLTAQGPLYSEGSSFTIVNWRFVSPPWFPLRMIYPQGVIGTLEIHCEGMWDLLKRYKFRKTYTWEAGERNLFQLLSWVLARFGFEFSSAGSSMTIANYYPPLTIREGTKASTIIKKLLSWCPDVLFQRGHFLYVKDLKSDESVDYDYNSTYGISHVVYRGNYGTGAWDPNRVQVWGDTFMAEEFNFNQIEQLYDRLVFRTKPEYPDVDKARDRAEAELRKGEVYTANPGWLQVPTNCGQEPFDVITITDTTAGVVNAKRRVLGIRTKWVKPFTYWQVFELGAP